MPVDDAVKAARWTRRDELAARFMQARIAADRELVATDQGARQLGLMAFRWADGFLAARAASPAEAEAFADEEPGEEDPLEDTYGGLEGRAHA